MKPVIMDAGPLVAWLCVLDFDFLIFRKHGSEVIPVIAPFAS